MSDFTFWIFYSRSDGKNVLVLKTKTNDCLTYHQVCELFNLKPEDFFYECITGLGFEVLSKTFFEFSNENLKSKNINFIRNFWSNL